MTPMVIIDYIAGFIDGDGCFSVHKRKPSMASREKSPSYRPKLHIVNTNRKVLEIFKSFFNCGNISILKKVKSNWKTCYNYEISGKQFFPILEILVNHLIVKKPVAEKILQYKVYFTNAYGRGNQYSGKQTLPQNVLQKREKLYKLCKKLNKKGI